MHDIMDEKAAQAAEKKAALGPDIDLSSFTAEPTDHGYLEDLTKLPMIDRQRILESGVDATEEGRSGTTSRRTRASSTSTPDRRAWRSSRSNGH